MSKYTDGARVYVLAHRGGGSGRLQENSLAAFENAHQLGCKYLETDVRLATDGNIYLAHGATSLLPNQSLKLIGQPHPTLEELFDSFPSSFFTIDPKHSLVIEPLAELIVKKKMADRVCIGASFDKRAEKVADLVEQKSGVRPATALVSVAASIRLLLNAAHIPIEERRNGPSFIHVHQKLISPAVIEAAHRQNLKIIAWVVNNKPTMQKFLEWKVDGFMTDYPSIVKGLLVV